MKLHDHFDKCLEKKPVENTKLVLYRFLISLPSVLFSTSDKSSVIN